MVRSGSGDALDSSDWSTENVLTHRGCAFTESKQEKQEKKREEKNERYRETHEHMETGEQSKCERIGW